MWLLQGETSKKALKEYNNKKYFTNTGLKT